MILVNALDFLKKVPGLSPILGVDRAQSKIMQEQVNCSLNCPGCNLPPQHGCWDMGFNPIASLSPAHSNVGFSCRILKYHMKNSCTPRV